MSEYQPNWRALIIFIVLVATGLSAVVLSVWGPGPVDTVPPLAGKFGLISVLTVGAWAAFVRWGFRWRWLHPWLVKPPNLHGRWEGHDEPLYYQGKKKRELAIEIEQTLLGLRCNAYIKDKQSHCLCASLVSDKDNTTFWVIYTYKTLVAANARAGDSHEGTVMLTHVPSPPAQLVGKWFNNRIGPEPTSRGGGDISVTWRSSKLKRRL